MTPHNSKTLWLMTSIIACFLITLAPSMSQAAKGGTPGKPGLPNIPPPDPDTDMQDDTGFFIQGAPPNILFLLDNSTSMNLMSWHKDYEQTKTSADYDAMAPAGTFSLCPADVIEDHFEDVGSYPTAEDPYAEQPMVMFQLPNNIDAIDSVLMPDGTTRYGYWIGLDCNGISGDTPLLDIRRSEPARRDWDAQKLGNDQEQIRWIDLDIRHSPQNFVGQGGFIAFDMQYFQWLFSNNVFIEREIDGIPTGNTPCNEIGLGLDLSCRDLSTVTTPNYTPVANPTEEEDIERMDLECLAVEEAAGRFSSLTLPAGISTFGGPYAAYHQSRMTLSQRILREVMCRASASSGDRGINFGVAFFRGPQGGERWTGGASQQKAECTSAPGYNGSCPTDANGGFVRVEMDDYENNLLTMTETLDASLPRANTPLSEALFQLYTYFMSRTEADRPVGADSSTKFPMYSYGPGASGAWNTNAGAYKNSGYSPMPSALDCTNSFIVVITDGSSSFDSFQKNSAETGALGFEDFGVLIGDYYGPGDETEEEKPLSSGTCKHSPPDYDGADKEECLESNVYLDDIAYFMNTNDYRPDLVDDQKIDTYTVGFTTTAASEEVLVHAAQRGGNPNAGLGGAGFYHSDDGEELLDGLADALEDIILKTQSFTAATVPATRTTTDNNFYASFFTPKREDGFWDGHLTNYTFSLSGKILDKDGECAVLDPAGNLINDIGLCISGPLASPTDRPPHWDASDRAILATPSTRNLFVSIGNAKTDFTTAEVDKFDLDVDGLTAAEITALSSESLDNNGDTLANAGDVAEALVTNLQGCEFGTGLSAGPACVKREFMLGDIFHSNPVVVAGPDGNHPDPSYKEFADFAINPSIVTRDRVIFAGSNDGFLRGLDAGTWDGVDEIYDHGTGDEVFGFMPYESRTRVKNIHAKKETIREGTENGDSDYFIDGSPQAADVWMHSSAFDEFKDWTEWKTVLITGMRQGGISYLALDINDPSSSSYPEYLWEWPLEGETGTIPADYLGESWSDPIITRMRFRVNGGAGFLGNGHERWVMIVGGGYARKGDPNLDVYDAADTQGRGIFIVDIKTGEVLAQKYFKPGAAVGGDADGGIADLEYSIPSSAAVYDRNQDGYADTIYIGDLGGNLWKWVVEPVPWSGCATPKACMGDDIVNGSTGTAGQLQWPFALLFKAPSVDVTIDSTTVTRYKSFFYPPSGRTIGGALYIGIASGERAALAAVGDPTTNTDNNRVYVFHDDHMLSVATGSTSTPIVVGEDDGTAATLDDITDYPSYADCGNGPGYYIRADETEKFVTNPVIFLNAFFVGSYIPSPAGSVTCSQGGISYLWGFDMKCGTVKQSINPDPNTPTDRKLEIGGGLASRPRISTGPSSPPPDYCDGLTGAALSNCEEEVAGWGGCGHRLVIVMSSGEIANECGGESSTDTRPHLKSWRRIYDY